MSEFMSDRRSESTPDKSQNLCPIECQNLCPIGQNLCQIMSELMSDRRSFWLTEWKYIFWTGWFFGWSLEVQLLARMLVTLIPACCYRKIRDSLIMLI